MISFICDVCDVNRDTYDPRAPGGLYLVHFGRKVLKLSGSWTPVASKSWMCLGGRIVAAPSHRRPMLKSAVMNSGVFFCTWSGYNVAFSILVSSVQPSTVSVRVFCGPTTCRARGNDVSATNILTRKQELQRSYHQGTSMISMPPAFRTQITSVPSDQSVQGTTHLVLLDRMYRDLRHTHRIWSWSSVFVRTLPL